MWYVVLVRPGDGCAGTHLNIRRLIREVLDVQCGNARDRSSLLGRILLIPSHHAAMVVLATHHPLIRLLSIHHPIAITVPHESTVCQRHSAHRASNCQQT